MRQSSNRVKATDFADIRRDARMRRTDDISSDIDTLATVAIFCGTGLLVSLALASYGWDLGSGFF